VYEEHDLHEDGSPLLIAKLASQIKASQHPFDLRCLNVESNRKRFDDLETATAPFKPEIVECNFHASFEQVIPDVLARVAESPAFFFIDPFGTKGIAFAKLLPVFKRRWTNEVLITFHTDGIAKKAGWFRKEDSPDPIERDNARRFIDHLAAALNIQVGKLRDGWRETADKGNTAAFEDRAVRYYLRQLRSRETRFKYVKPFKVRYYDPDEPLRHTPVCFHLIFATQHEKGLFKMNDAMADAVRKFHAEIYSASLLGPAVAELEQQESVKALEREIRGRFRGKTFTIDDVKREGMQTDYVLLRGSEYRKLILRMSNGDLEKIDSGATSNSTTRFRIRSKDRLG
jgi:three-Cys-motif partner protein